MLCVFSSATSNMAIVAPNPPTLSRAHIFNSKAKMENPPPAGPKEPSPLKRLLHFFGIDRPHESAKELDQEIQELIDEGEEQGLISRHEGEMINSILEFRDTLTREIMTPSSQMTSASLDTPYKDLVRLITEKGYTRIPIYSESPDHIIGILHAKDLLKFCSTDLDKVPMQKIIRPACFVLETQKILDLLKYFQAQKIHMAIVTDEFGGVRGLITLEDIIEEIVGEIADESDKAELRLQKLDDNTLLTDAQINIEEIEDFFHTEMPEGDYDSVGGLIIQQLGRLPEAHTTVTIEPLIFEVVAADKRRIKTVKIRRKTEAP